MKNDKLLHPKFAVGISTVAGTTTMIALCSVLWTQGLFAQVDVSAPSIPSSISVPATSSTGTYTISWGAATGTVTNYELQEGTEPSFSCYMPPCPPGRMCIQMCSTPPTIYSGPDLSVVVGSGFPKLNGTYYYQVRACNINGCGPFQTATNAVVVTIQVVSPLPLSALNDGTQVQVPAYAKYIRDLRNGLWPASVYFEKPSAVNPNCVIEHSRGWLGSGFWFPFDPTSNSLGRFGYRTTLLPMLSCALPDCIFTDSMLITREEIICPLPAGSIVPFERFGITVFPGEVKVINGETWALVPREPNQFPNTSWVTVVPPGKKLGLPTSGDPYIQNNTFEEVTALGGGVPPIIGAQISPRATWEVRNGRTKIYVTGLATSGNTGQDIDDYFTTTSNLMGQPGGFDPTVAAISDFISNQRVLNPTQGIDIYGHSLGCYEATLLYDLWYFVTGDNVFCLAPPAQLPANRMLPNASGASYTAYGGIGDGISGYVKLNQERRAAGVRIFDVDTGILTGIDTHDRCRYEVAVFSGCFF